MARNLKDITSKEFTEKRQKQLIQAVRSYLLAKEISVNHRIPFDVLYSTFSSCSYEKKIVSFYAQLMDAKSSGRLIDKDSVEEIICILVKERSTLDQNAQELPHGKEIRSELNEWIWTLLGHRSPYFSKQRDDCHSILQELML